MRSPLRISSSTASEQLLPSHAGGLAAGFTHVDEGEAIAIGKEAFGLDGSVVRFPTEKDDTFRFDGHDGRKWILKIANPNEDWEELSLQVELLAHLEKVAPDLPVPRVSPSLKGAILPKVTTSGGEDRYIRLLSYMPGMPLASTTSTPQNREKIGELLAALRHACSTFSHPGDSRTLAWDVRHLSDLRHLLDYIDDRRHRAQIEMALERFKIIEPQLARCRTQVLHNDFNTSNIVVNPADERFVTGIIDFGDTVRTAIAIDVSTALMNQLPGKFDDDREVDFLGHAKDVLRGYLRGADLTDDELMLIPHLAMARVVTRALLTTWRAKLFPQNSTYILRNTDAGWVQLEWFLDRSFDDISQLLLPPPGSTGVSLQGLEMSTLPKGFRGDMANGFDPASVESLDSKTREHIERRSRLLGPAYRLFYSEPLRIARGAGVYLYDDAGDEYLDAYNNVVSVGHAHPRVTAAISRQLDTLCTHTRYMQDGILGYAEKLLATFEGEIGAGHTMFTCTGSEANDLAMRIARHHTGHEGVIVTAEAYHGNSGVTSSFSPSLGKRSTLGPMVRTVPPPDSYRIEPEHIGQWMADNVAKQIEDIKRHGGGLAAFIVDSLFSSDGLYSHPVDVLKPVAQVVRSAGGLFIADEVQCGFGRSGTHMWGHRRHGVDPDIVTLGKPMGNGYPVAGVVVRSDVVANFGRDMRYFNTFGGNTVAIAAAEATLDVIQEEGLMTNATRVGKIILDGLTSIAAKYEQIGDVRGTGLYFGVELVKDRKTKASDIDTGLAIVNRLRQRRVLISATGADANVLKIRPPLVFTEANADRLLTEVEASFASL